MNYSQYQYRNEFLNEQNIYDEIWLQVKINNNFTVIEHNGVPYV